MPVKVKWVQRERLEQLSCDMEDHIACAVAVRGQTVSVHAFRDVRRNQVYYGSMNTQPWLAKPREWLGVPNFIAERGTDWALVTENKKC